MDQSIRSPADLFGEAEQVTRIDLERRRIALDPGLDEAERSEQIAALDEQLPGHVRDVRARASAPARARVEVQQLREAGGSEAEVFAVRERYFGPEAAERLAALDVEQHAWEERLDAYRVERDALRERQAEDPEAFAAELDALRREHFGDHEQARVRALDGLGP